MPLAPAKIKMVCDVLVRDRLLKPEMVETVTGKAQRTGDRVEEVILDLGLVSESDLLKSLATHYKVYFISTEKLSQVNVPRGIVEMVSQRFAEKMGVCPVMYDGKNQSLSVVTSDPDDIEALQETQLASGARDVKGIYARPAAVKALMAKAYQGDTRAFAQIDRPGQNLNTYGSDIAIDIDLGPAPAQAPRIERIEKARPPSPPAPPPVRSPASANRSAPPAGSPVPPSLDEPDAGVTLDGPLDRRERSERPERTGGARAAKSAEKVSDASFVELLHVLVSLLESSRADLRGHSAEVARLVRRVGDKLGLDPSVTAMFVVAAFVHDLGKMGQYHLTTLNCSEYDGHKAAAQKAWELPARLLEPVRLPPDALQIASRMYERYDGKGFPDGLSGKDIPLGARVLAVCDTYADLTSNARNPFRKTLSPQEACIAIAKHKETIFDPNVFDLFRNTVLGEELTAKLLANRSQALLVDADPEETTVLELRLIEQGFVVKTARSVEQALKILGDGDTDLVVSEIEIGSSDGLGLLADARKQPWGKDLAWVVYTRRHERTVAQKAFDLGVLDYVTKPASADLLVAKLKALLDQRASASPRNTRGVSGSLREMGLPDMVQVLFHGRKTGKLEIRAPQGTGEIHFAEGNIVDAVWRDGRGEPAFYAMLKLTDGDFALDPSFKPPTRAIQQSPEALLLEGMRRLDEGIA